MRILFLILLSSQGLFWQQVNAQIFRGEQPTVSDINPGVFISNDLLNENDGGVSAIYSVPDYQCTSFISPSVEIVNSGSNVLTNALIKYYIDSQSPSYLQWEGNLVPGEVAVIEFDSIEVMAGSHKLTVSIVEANGLVDINGGNNDGLIDFYIVGTSVPAPVFQEFETSALPEGYFVENYDDGVDDGWDMYIQEKELGDNNYMLQMHFYYNVDQNPDEVYIKNVDLSNASNADMNFDLAYCYYKNSGVEKFDKLLVEASGNCGMDWDILYEKEKDELATLPPTGVEFFPIEDWQWRTESVDLNNYLGNSNVMIRFEAISGHGNNLYVDNLKISSIVGVEALTGKNVGLKLYPNPADQHVMVNISKKTPEQAVIIVCNTIGQQVYASTLPFSTDVFNIETASWPQGMYLVQVFNQNILAAASRLSVLH